MAMSEPFVGRGELLAALRARVDRDHPGAAAALVLRGARGVGRSALLGRLREWAGPGELVELPFASHAATPGQLAGGLFRRVLEVVKGGPVDPALPPGRWLDGLPAATRARVGPEIGELRPGAHPARALRCLVRGIEGLARDRARPLVVAMDDPDVLRDMQGFPGLPRRGFPLSKFFVASPWVRWVLSPRYPGAPGELEDLAGVEVLDVPPLRRAESYHLAALFLETEFRPVPRALLWPLHGLSGGRPGYLKALVLRVLQDRRVRAGVPGAEAVEQAFLRECLEPTGRIGLACEAELSRAGSGVVRAVVELLARRGPLGVESISQLLGVGRARTLEKIVDLAERGILLEREGRYDVADRVLALRLRLLAEVGPGQDATTPRARGVLEEFRAGELVDLHGGGAWERRVRGFLARADGRAFPGERFASKGTVLLPSHAAGEAPVGFDARGEVDGYPGIVASDLLWNGRDRRWIVELPDTHLPLGVDAVARAGRLGRWFRGSSRRAIEHVWIASRGGFTAEARAAARGEGVLLSDEGDLDLLERDLVPRAA